MKITKVYLITTIISQLDIFGGELKSHKIENLSLGRCKICYKCNLMIRREHRHWVYGIMTGWLHGFRIMTRPLHICRGLGVVVHGGGVLLDILQVLGVPGGLVEVRGRDLFVGIYGIMTGWLHGFRIMTRPLHISWRWKGGRGRFLLCVVVHGGGILLDLLQVLGILGGLVEVRV